MCSVCNRSVSNECNGTSKFKVYRFGLEYYNVMALLIYNRI